MASASAGEPQPAVFLSYAREDTAATRRLAEGLRAGGVEVWFDETELRGGEAWDRSIRKQIRDCALFMPVISASTQARGEGYFRLEWHLAEQRSFLIAKGRPFITPVCLDATPGRDSLVPDAFLSVQWTRLPGGETPPEFVRRVRALIAGEVLQPPDAAPGVGDPPLKVAGAPRIPDYDLQRMIGQGSYGDVWLARGLTGVYRAIKVVWRNRFPNAEPFEREFKGLKEFASMALPEASQLALLHVGQNASAGFFYYVMELADDVELGREVIPEKYTPLTLKELCVRRRRLPAPECVKFGVALARALAGLHTRGLVHRDIKPSNIILVGGVPKLADIGLVASSTAAASFVGTEGYVPPEGPGKPAADVFALGKLLYQLMTGFDRQEYPRLPPELGGTSERKALFELNQIILRACEPRPCQRYADASAMLADLLVLQTGSSLRRRRTITWVRRIAVTVAIVAVAATGAGWWWKQHARTNSIAVLHFKNLSEEKGSAHFAGGMHDSILTSLAQIGRLRVVSSTSVEQYRDSKKSLRQIAQELGVAYVLEGSVQQTSNRVRVTGQLIRAASDDHVWAETYDKDLTDIFAIQSELAKRIAESLYAALSPQEKQLLERKPTENLAAYERYAQAMGIMRSKDGYYDELMTVETLLQAAVQLDPNFVLAWERLCFVHGWAYYDHRDHTDARLAKCREAMEKIIVLAPDSPSRLRAVGGYYMFGLRDWERAKEALQRLVRLQPHDCEALAGLSVLARKQGRWLDALAYLRAVQKLDPRFHALVVQIQWVLEAGRRYREAEDERRRSVDPQKDGLRASFALALLAFRARGSTTEVEQFLAKLSAADANSDEGVKIRKRWAILVGNREELARLDQLKPDLPAAILYPYFISTEPLQLAVVLASQGDVAGARARLAPEADRLRQELARKPADPTLWANMSLIEALLGHPAEALRYSQKSVDLVPESNDLEDGLRFAVSRAFVYAWTGDKDRAIAEYGRLLRVPNSELNVYEMKHDPWYAPLRGDPRFEALLNDPKNNAPLF